VEVGAGGGSEAWIDAGGALRVGPRSAGARPGPACYGLGGATPTITDANLALGRLDPSFFLGGEMMLDADAARRRVGKGVREILRDAPEVAADAARVGHGHMGGRLLAVGLEYDRRPVLRRSVELSREVQVKLPAPRKTMAFAPGYPSLQYPPCVSEVAT